MWRCVIVVNGVDGVDDGDVVVGVVISLAVEVAITGPPRMVLPSVAGFSFPNPLSPIPVWSAKVTPDV